LADLLTITIIGVIAVMMSEALNWNFKARIVPMIVGTIGLGFGTMALLHNVFTRDAKAAAAASGEGKKDEALHMDLESDTAHIDRNLLLARAAIFYGWMVAFMISMAVIGLIPTVPIFVIAFMRFEGPEPWRLVLPQAIILTIFIYVMFDQMMTIPWPPTLLGDFFPQLKGVIPSV
jgi:hypothetical protein